MIALLSRCILQPERQSATAKAIR